LNTTELEKASKESLFLDKNNYYDFLQKSLETIEDYAVFMLDADGFIKTWSGVAQKIKGYAPSEIIGKHISVFYPEEDCIKFSPYKEISIATEQGRFEDFGWRVKKNGDKFQAKIVITALKNDEGTVIGFSKVVRDLTLKSNSSDKKRISELEESIRIRDEFISLASHELRTPVTRILLNLQIIKRYGDDLKDKVMKSLDVCENSTKDLIIIMDNLVDVTRLRLGKLDIRRTKTNITTVLLQTIEKYKDQIRIYGNHVTVIHDGDVIGYWDQTRLDQLFSNLLSNAIKYTDGRPIRMELRKGEKSITFSIADEGPGIPYHMQSKVFERFGRASDPRKISGLGLGLYVSRQIVEAHKGEIGLESRPGQGAKFIVHLPLKQEKR
jgi:PAS domain S-box-containing protein